MVDMSSVCAADRGLGPAGNRLGLWKYDKSWIVVDLRPENQVLHTSIYLLRCPERRPYLAR